MSKKIILIEVFPPIYFPHEFFGGRMHLLAVILEPDVWPWKALSWSPEKYKKKPCPFWLESSRPLATELGPLQVSRAYNTIWQVEVSETRFKKFLEYWEQNCELPHNQMSWINNGTKEDNNREL